MVGGKAQSKFGVDWRRVKTRITPVLLEEDGGYLSEASVLANTTDVQPTLFFNRHLLNPSIRTSRRLFRRLENDAALDAVGRRAVGCETSARHRQWPDAVHRDADH